jgi:hypothetical protein
MSSRSLCRRSDLIGAAICADITQLVINYMRILFHLKVMTINVQVVSIKMVFIHHLKGFETMSEKVMLNSNIIERCCANLICNLASLCKEQTCKHFFKFRAAAAAGPSCDREVGNCYLPTAFPDKDSRRPGVAAPGDVRSKSTGGRQSESAAGLDTARLPVGRHGVPVTERRSGSSLAWSRRRSL